MERDPFVYVTYIAATPERIWSALTDGTLTRQYWGGRAVESDWKPGSPVVFRKTSGEADEVRAQVLEARPGSHLAMSWTLPDGQAAPGTSRVSYTLERVAGEEVKLTLRHEATEAGGAVADRLRESWPAILSSLKSFLETGVALEVTRRWEQEAR